MSKPMKSLATDPATLGKRLDWLLTAVYDATSDQTVRGLVQDMRVTAELWAETQIAAARTSAARPPTDYGLARDALVWVLAALIGLGAGAMGYVVMAAFRGG
jgi:hypothetical protein